MSIFDDTNIEIMDLSINNKDNLIQITTIGDLHLIQGTGVIPNDDGYHLVNIQFNKNGRTIFKIDDVVYLNLISAETNSPFSSLNSNDKSYSLFIGSGEGNNKIFGDITNITLNIPISTYYQIPDDSIPTAICYQIVDELPIDFILPVTA
eukprot:412727_1